MPPIRGIHIIMLVRDSSAARFHSKFVWVLEAVIRWITAIPPGLHSFKWISYSQHFLQNSWLCGVEVSIANFTFLLRGKSFKEFRNWALFQIDTFAVRSLLMKKYFPDNLFEHFHPFKLGRHQRGACFLHRSSLRSHRLPKAMEYAQL